MRNHPLIPALSLLCAACAALPAKEFPPDSHPDGREFEAAPPPVGPPGPTLPPATLSQPEGPVDVAADEAIRQNVHSALLSSPIDFSWLQVEVSDGRVILEGVVDSSLAVRRARDIAAAIPGVEEVSTDALHVR